MAVGANLNYKSQHQMWPMLREILNSKRHAWEKASSRKLCYKAGVPANNTADDNPNALGDICIDITNVDVYICTAWTTDASATTWVKITP
jgi:hypothetical protein